MKMKHIVKVIFIFSICFFYFSAAFTQLIKTKQAFTHADTLRGSNGPGRDWWNVILYDISVHPDLSDQTISGYSTIIFKPTKSGELLQFDLQEPLVVDAIDLTEWENKGTVISPIWTVLSEQVIKDYSKTGNAYFVSFPFKYRNGMNQYNLMITYHGKPKQAINAPWDGGLVWTKDKNNNPWISVACQGLGASVWYPCKDYQGDEPDSGVSFTMTLPDSLTLISNGKLLNKTSANGRTSWEWNIRSPINNYDLAFYIGKYAHFSEVYKGLKGDLTMDYWVLDYNLEKAKEHFKDAAKMMKAFEYWFGPYPFYEDGYKLVDAPYLGMEHQSAIAYGNGYMNGYLGRDLSGSGWGEKWDFIIVHESGHEWFGNNITTNDIADMWVHEGFTNYSEVLFTEFYYGKEAGNEYAQGLRKNIVNDIPVIGPYNVYKEGSADMYYKGSNMIHTIRQIINNDTLFRQILRGLNRTFYHQTVTTKQIEDYICKESRKDLSKVFDQYLRTIQVPVLEYKQSGFDLEYRWTNCVKGFNMPLKIVFKGERWINPTEQWQKLSMYPEGSKKFSVDPNFYINTKKVK